VTIEEPGEDCVEDDIETYERVSPLVLSDAFVSRSDAQSLLQGLTSMKMSVSDVLAVARRKYQ
jgi:hypothetical protein